MGQIEVFTIVASAGEFSVDKLLLVLVGWLPPRSSSVADPKGIINLKLSCSLTTVFDKSRRQVWNLVRASKTRRWTAVTFEGLDRRSAEGPKNSPAVEDAVGNEFSDKE